jgi:hypothetical protein
LRKRFLALKIAVGQPCAVRGALGEIAGNSAALVDPESIGSIAAQLSAMVFISFPTIFDLGNTPLSLGPDIFCFAA